MRLLLLGLGGIIPALALAEPIDFAIPAEPADRALLEFSKRAGMEVLFPFDELRKAESTAVIGRFEREQALEHLLQGTRFTARHNGRGGFVITPVKHPAEGRKSIRGPPRRAEPASSSDETTRLAPFLVMGRADSGPDRTLASQVPVGNVDLARTENDALPYTIYGRDRIARSGAVNLDDFLRQEVLESDAAMPPPEEGGAAPGTPAYLSGSANGSTNVNLRGFGSDETVILVNGLPLPELLSSAGTTTSRAADVNLIPLNLVERIEVLPVSASALYSGNPVGGVINIVLRPIQDLTEVTATYSNGVRVDAPESSFSLLHGESLLDGRLHFRINASFNRNIPPTEGELGYIQANLAAHPDINDPPNIYPPPVYRATPNIASDNQTPLFGLGTPATTSVAPGADGTGGLGAFANRQGVPSLGLFRAPGGNANSPSSLESAYGRRQSSASYFASATYDLSPRIQFGLEGLYSETVTNPGYDLFQGNLHLSANSPINPFNQLVDVTLNESTPLLGQGYDEARTGLTYLVLGLLLKLPRDWRVSMDAQYSQSITRYRGLAGVDPIRWQELVDEGLYNPLRDTQAHGPPAAFYNQALIFFGVPGRFVTLDNDQTVDSALRITNRTLGWPTGPGTLSFGTDYRIDRTANFDDDQRYGDGSLADTSGIWEGRTLQTVSVFGEVQAPLLPSRWLPDWIHRVGTDLAARYNASDVPLGTNVSPTFGIKLDFAGGLSARASISKTNRFPTSSLNRFLPVPGGTGTGAAGALSGNLIIDPLRGDEKYEVSSSEAPVTSVIPEADVTQSAGLIFQRGQVHAFRLSVDFYDTRKSNELDDLDAQDVINLESMLPGHVTRSAPTPGDPFRAGPITYVLTGPVNVAWRHSQNWSTSLDYGWTECEGGTLQLYARWAFFQKYDRALLAGSPAVDELNQPDTSGLDLLRNRINFGAGWSNRRCGFGLDGQYFSSRILPSLLWADQGSNHIDPFFPFAAYVKGDLTRWLPWTVSRFGLSAQLRVGNIFAASLPKFPDNPSGTGVEPYGDWRGRVYSLSFTASY